MFGLYRSQIVGKPPRRRIPGLETLEDRRVMSVALPAGFVESPVAVGLTRPTAMAVAPDGRIFVTEQHGTVRIIDQGRLLSRPFLKVDTNDISESGLIGIALDPEFATNHYVYLQYTTSPFSEEALHNRVSRFTANGNVVIPGSEKVLFDLDTHNAGLHMGGALNFGGDGKLYITTGDGGDKERAQRLDNTFGKILRINPDGTIPGDNPFANRLSGKYRAIWAYGLRNPFKFAVQPGTGKIFINDVGQRAYEEINLGRRGANYGWPSAEGPTSNPEFDSPIFAYPRDGAEVSGVCITGGAFYNPDVAPFPDSYAGDYFFADFGAGHIFVRDASTGSASVFASGSTYETQPIDLAVSRLGDLYYLTRGDGDPSGGTVHRISVANARPVVQLSGDVAYRENSAPVQIAPTGSVSDADNANFANGKLVVRITSGSESADRLGIRTTSNLVLSSGNIVIQGITIGSYSGGAGATALTIQLNTNATPTRVTGLLRNITYRSVSQDPSTVQRQLEVTLHDGSGGISNPATMHMQVEAVNDRPLLRGIGGEVAYTEDTAAIAIAPTATVTDPDSANFATGKLIVQITEGLSDSNRLVIGGAFVVSGNRILLDDVVVGWKNTDGGVGRTRLVVTFSAYANQTTVQKLLRSLRFRTVNNDTLDQRKITFTLTDGDGGINPSVAKRVNVESGPT